jgi:hypothetical protein
MPESQIQFLLNSHACHVQTTNRQSVFHCFHRTSCRKVINIMKKQLGIYVLIIFCSGCKAKFNDIKLAEIGRNAKRKLLK